MSLLLKLALEAQELSIGGVLRGTLDVAHDDWHFPTVTKLRVEVRGTVKFPREVHEIPGPFHEWPAPLTEKRYSFELDLAQLEPVSYAGKDLQITWEVIASASIALQIDPAVREVFTLRPKLR